MPFFLIIAKDYFYYNLFRFYSVHLLKKIVELKVFSDMFIAE